jgi:redox-sensitive bicupin YhaK (pirin superfamily)
VDPFLLIDEMGPMVYGPDEAIGAPDHPHRGFETVTYVLDGEFEHRDSVGNHGVLRGGDVQWMTAGAGVVHSEMPTAAFRARGGRMHGFQLWVNLPAAKKWAAPRYQDIPAAQIPEVSTDDGLARGRIVAGSALGVSAVIETYTPISLHHWTLASGAKLMLPVPTDQDVLVYVFAGTLRTGETTVSDGQMAIFGPGDAVALEGPADDTVAQALLIGGAPIGEPMVRMGPFVMNTREELVQAYRDYQAGRLGRIT